MLAFFVLLFNQMLKVKLGHLILQEFLQISLGNAINSSQFHSSELSRTNVLEYSKGMDLEEFGNLISGVKAVNHRHSFLFLSDPLKDGVKTT